MAVLVTGGAGYIGSHTVVELQNAGYDVVVLDNLSNASEKALDRVSKITGKPVKFYKADILDRDALNDIFDKETIESCIHFAGWSRRSSGNQSGSTGNLFSYSGSHGKQLG